MALNPEVVDPLFAATRPTDPLGRLTHREREVLHPMAQGHTNAAIAERLFLSRSSVEKYVNSVFDKLDLPRARARRVQPSGAGRAAVPGLLSRAVPGPRDPLDVGPQLGQGPSGSGRTTTAPSG